MPGKYLKRSDHYSGSRPTDVVINITGSDLEDTDSADECGSSTDTASECGEDDSELTLGHVKRVHKNGDFKIYIKDSEEVFDICCSPCSENGVIKAGKQFCVDCDSHLCDTCLQYHRQFPALRSHQIVDKSHGGSGSAATGVLTERCSIHPGHCIDRYCKDHDEICCQACITIKHRSCKNVNSLAEVAKGIKDSKEHKDTMEELDIIVRKIKQEKEQRNETLTCLDAKKDSALLDIEEFQDKLINRIKQLAEVSRKEVISKHAERVKTVKSDVKELETVLSVAEGSVKKVNTSGLKEEQLFVNVKSGKTITRDVGAIITEFSGKKTQKEFSYCFDEKLSYAVKSMKSLGDFNDIPYHATKYTPINVNSQEVNAISVFEDGTFAYVDFCNKSLTRVNDQYAVIDTIELPGSPSSLCITEPQEVAVALRAEKKIQFVACNKTLSLGNSFTTTMVCTGLCYDPICDHLYVCLGEKWKGDKSACLAVYKKDGTFLKTYTKDETGSMIFSTPSHIAIGSNSIYIADLENGIIALNKDGKRLWKFEDETLKGAWGVCLLFDGTLLVTGYFSNNVLQVSADGEKMCELIGSSAGENHPFSLTIDKRNSRILLGSESSVISVYTLSR